MTTDPTPNTGQPTAPRCRGYLTQKGDTCPLHGQNVAACYIYSDQQAGWAPTAASVPAPEQDEAVRLLREPLRSGHSRGSDPDEIPGHEPEQDEAVRRTSYLHVTDFERLEEWCRLVRVVTGEVPYLVGSVHTSPDYRDVDLRVILPDPVFDRWWSDPLRVRLVNRALSTWGRQETGLPIDLQVQRQTEANRDFPGFRNPMGLRDWSVQRTSGVPLATPPPAAPEQDEACPVCDLTDSPDHQRVFHSPASGDRCFWHERETGCECHILLATPETPIE